MSNTVDVYIGDNKYMTFDQETLDDFIDANNKALLEDAYEFEFQEESFRTDFAGQVIDYVKRKLP